jgi:hypothetical protein
MGLASAQAFAESGAAVVLADSNEQPLRSAAAELTSAGHQALDVGCDVSDEEQVAALVERTVDTFGRLDFAFNNAGIQAGPTDAADEPAETFDRVNAINLRGVWACMKHDLPGDDRDPDGRPNALLIALLATVSLSACGGDDEDGNQPAGAPETSTRARPQPPMTKRPAPRTARRSGSPSAIRSSPRGCTTTPRHAISPLSCR